MTRQLHSGPAGHTMAIMLGSSIRCSYSQVCLRNPQRWNFSLALLSQALAFSSLDGTFLFLIPLHLKLLPQLPADLRMQSRLTLASRPAWSAPHPARLSDLTSPHSPLLPPCSSFLQQASFSPQGLYTCTALCLELSSRGSSISPFGFQR